MTGDQVKTVDKNVIFYSVKAQLTLTRQTGIKFQAGESPSARRVGNVWTKPQLTDISLPEKNICLHFWRRFRLLCQLLGASVHILWLESVLIPAGGAASAGRLSCGHVTTPLISFRCYRKRMFSELNCCFPSIQHPVGVPSNSSLTTTTTSFIPSLTLQPPQ